MDVVRRDDLRIFGGRAQAQAAHFENCGPGIFCDGTRPELALAAAVDLRNQGKPFFAWTLLDDQRSVVARTLAASLYAQPSDEMARRQIFDALATQQLTVNNARQDQLTLMDGKVLKTMRDVAWMADVTLANSSAHLARTRALFGRARPHFAVIPRADASVPAVQSKGTRIVVWAPQFDALQMGVFAMAADQLRDDVIIACASGEIPFARAHFVRPNDDILAQACAVIDASTDDPGMALALAACGVPIAVTAASGAHEWIEGAYVYDSWNWRSVLAAFSAVRGGLPARVLPVPPVEMLAEALALSQPKISVSPPLVSMIVPTYNRPALLERCLQSLQRQQYPNIEIIVVNDAGCAVDDIVAKFPNARLINKTQNEGCARAQNTGAGHASGKYVALLSDDDLYYPSFLTHTVSALERSAGQIANSNTIIRFVEGPAGGEQRLRGYGLGWYSYLDRFELLWTASISTGGLLWRREVFDALGLFEDLACCDYEFLVRLASTYDFVHVDCVTFEWTYDLGKSTLAHSMGIETIVRDYEKVWSRYPHPSSQVSAGREQTAAWFRQNVNGHYFQPDIPLA